MTCFSVRTGKGRSRFCPVLWMAPILWRGEAVWRSVKEHRPVAIADVLGGWKESEPIER